jgi:hypothetical protein
LALFFAGDAGFSTGADSVAGSDISDSGVEFSFFKSENASRKVLDT